MPAKGSDSGLWTQGFEGRHGCVKPGQVLDFDLEPLSRTAIAGSGQDVVHRMGDGVATDGVGGEDDA